MIVTICPALTIIHSILVLVDLPMSAQVMAAPCTAGTALPASVSTALNNIVNALTGVGAAVCALGIAVGGLMRGTSFSSERRVSESNTAIACAVVGLLIVLLARGASTWLSGLITPDCGP